MKKDNDYNAQLRQLIALYQLNVEKIALLTKLSEETIKAWLAPKESKQYQTLSVKEYSDLHSALILNHFSDTTTQKIHIISELQQVKDTLLKIQKTFQDASPTMEEEFAEPIKRSFGALHTLGKYIADVVPQDEEERSLDALGAKEGFIETSEG